MVRVLAAEHAAALSTPRQMTRFLCGISSPGLTRAKLSRHPSLGALALTWAVSRYALDIPWRPLPLLTAAGIGLTAAVVAGVGLLASWEVLQRKPLATLRGE